MPVRKISNKGGKKKTGLFPSEKTMSMVDWESPLENDYMFLLEFDRTVVSFEAQPMTITYKFNGRTRRYTPDLKVQKKNDEIQIIEVKPQDKLMKLLNDEEFKTRIIAAHSFCKTNGWEFKIVTDADIRAGSILKNIKLLFKFSRIQVPSSDYLKIRNELLLKGSNGYLSIEGLAEALGKSLIEKKRIKAYVFALLWSQKIVCDLTREINTRTLVRLP